MSRVIVGVDGSEGSIEALQFAVEEARLRGTELLAVNAWHIPPGVYGSGWAPTPLDLDEYRKLAQKALEASLVDAGITDAGVAVTPAPPRRPAGRRPLPRGRDRRPPRRRLARPRRVPRPPARLGEPAGRPPRALPGRDRAEPAEARRRRPVAATGGPGPVAGPQAPATGGGVAGFAPTPPCAPPRAGEGAAPAARPLRWLAGRAGEPRG